MTLETIPIFHAFAVRLVTAQATLEFCMYWVTLVALQPGMGSRMLFHHLANIAMTTQAHGAD